MGRIEKRCCFTRKAQCCTKGIKRYLHILENINNNRFLQFIRKIRCYFWIIKSKKMLSDKKVKAFVITTDALSAKKFYSEILEFKFLNGDEYGLEFEMNNSLLRVSITTEENAIPQKHTVLGWCVPDIYESVQYLKNKGIQFERYGFLQQDENDVWKAESGTKVAWFKDPHGNLLSIDQAG